MLCSSLGRRSSTYTYIAIRRNTYNIHIRRNTYTAGSPGNNNKQPFIIAIIYSFVIEKSIRESFAFLFIICGV